MSKDTFILKIYRGTPKKQYWESFELELNHGENVISALMQIQKKPVTVEKKVVDPVVWEQACLEEVCGSCAMLVNSIPRQACTALIEDYLRNSKNRTIYLAPLTKFPLIRDLIVDRSILFKNLEKIKGWIDKEVEGNNFGEKVSKNTQEIMYTLSTCMTCGCCSEVCPQVNKKSCFMGPAAVSQARLFNLYPGEDKKVKKERIKSLMDNDGVVNCGQAQNCARVCPKNIPLTEGITAMSKATSIQGFRDIIDYFKKFFKKDSPHNPEDQNKDSKN